MIARRALQAIAESRSTLENPGTDLLRALSASDYPLATAGIRVTPESAQRIVAVMACVKLISQTVGALPLGVFWTRNGKRTAYETSANAFIWKRPNPEMTRQTYIENVVGHRLLRGNAYSYKQRNRAGQVVELWPINPDRVRVGRTSAGVKVFEIDGEPRAFTRDEILHVPGFSRDGMVGLSPIAEHAQSVAVAMAAEEFGARFFSQGSQLGGVLSVPGKLEETDANRLFAQWNKRHAGVSKAHQIAILDSGAQYTQIGVAPNDAQYIEVRKFQVTEIARMFGVPPHLIGDVERSTSWGSGIEEQGIQFVQFTLLPILIGFEQAFTDELLGPNQYAKFNVSGLLRGNQSARYSAYQTGRAGGWLSLNDIRALEDLDLIDDPAADIYVVQQGFAPISSLLQQPAPEEGAPPTESTEVPQENEGNVETTG